MATKYHVGRDGMPKVCKAHSGSCPLGEEDEHFEDKMDALEYATQKLEEEYGSVSSHRRKTDYHIGESGAIEICDSPESCPVKPYKKFKNVHSTDQNVVIGAGQAFREAIGAINATERRAKKPSTLSPPVVASDPVTDAARRARGSIRPVGTYRPKHGDVIRVKRDFPGARTPSVRVTATSDPDKDLQDMLDAGVPPEAIEVMTADSCHHSVQAPDLSNTTPMDRLSRPDGSPVQYGDKISATTGNAGEPTKEVVVSPGDDTDELLHDFISEGFYRDEISVEEGDGLPSSSSSASGSYPVVNVGPTLKPYAGARKIENGEVYAGEEVYECSGPPSLRWRQVTDDKMKNPPRHRPQSGDYISAYDEDGTLVQREMVYNDGDEKIWMQEMIDSGFPSEDIYVEPKVSGYGPNAVHGDPVDPDFTGVDIGAERNTSRPYRPRVGDVILTQKAGTSSMSGSIVPAETVVETILKKMRSSGWKKDEITVLTKDSGYTEVRIPELPTPSVSNPRPASPPQPSSYSNNSWASGRARC